MDEPYYYHYCPYCGQSQYKSDYGKTITCSGCLQIITPSRSKYEDEYYTKKSVEKYQKTYYGKEKILFDEEIKLNPLFNNECYNKRMKKSEQVHNDFFNRITSTNNTNENIPKCPTCSSTNISKISTVSKAAGAAMFGLFSKTARSQFKCNNCGYKW